MPKVLYYVSGHGYGHASRAAELIRHLLAIRPDCTVTVRTVAPQLFFACLPKGRVAVEAIQLDPGVVEEGSLRVNAERTVQAVMNFMDRQHEIVAGEVEFVRNHGVSLIVADIPFVAGEIAEMASVPCVAVSNFTWDWIYEPYFILAGGGEQFLDRIRASYRKMTLLLRLPFCHSINSDVFNEVLDVPLLARRSQRDLRETLNCLSVADSDLRPRVFLAIRGHLTAEVINWSAAASPELLFLVPNPPDGLNRENIRPVVLDQQLSFADVLSVSDVVVSKLGYSILAECVASRKALLWPPRLGFREDKLLSSAASRYLRSLEISVADFTAGHWAASLRTILSLPQPADTIATNGGEVCAAILAARF